jgi:hypothetical protein
MIEGWLHHVKLSIQARGVSPALPLWGAIAAVALAVALTFLTIAGYIWLERRYDSLTAALALAGVYLIVAIIAVIALAVARRRTIERAQRELALRKPQPWLDPQLLAMGVQLGRSIGWKKGLPLAAAGLLAAGIAREWSAHRAAASNDKD